ncbi:Fungal lipase-like domain [Arabidopsis suecica]|uniref:Fungal lipase-like domain n=1 Tax=Arabidopsis suecica TaxID=45249 RepID=A0A8T2BPV0_ARASU|nr:Fungal lipase-like domain [Arabidopsis suecica]
MVQPENYFVLDPREATVMDLMRLLFYSDLENRKFVDTSVENLENRLCEFRGRWIIFVSIVVQKLLIILRKPLSFLGFALGFWLNLPSSNGGFFKIFLNLVKGRFIWPEKTSATFASINGNLDQKVELGLGRSIKIGDERYKPLLSIMASKLSYENENLIRSVLQDHWQMDLLGFYSCPNDYDQTRSTEVIVIRDTKENPNLIVVSFRGTDPFNADDWCTDLDLSWYTSLGGALAILFTAVLMMHEKEMLERLEGVYTFGQPRVGNEDFGNYMKDKLKEFDVKYKRYVYCNDMVPRLPFDDKTLMFKHFGGCLYCNSFYKGKVEEEEPNKNYFNIFWVIPKILNAVWELIRSFIISCWQGREYREGWLLTCFRLVALLIPGLPAHFPNEYVNVALLGNFPPQVPDSQNLHDDDLNVSLLRN